MFERRLQILLDQARYERVAAAAEQRGVSVARIIREAIDGLLPAAPSKRAAAARRVLSADRMPVPPPEELTAELESIRSRRA